MFSKIIFITLLVSVVALPEEIELYKQRRHDWLESYSHFSTEKAILAESLADLLWVHQPVNECNTSYRILDLGCGDGSFVRSMLLYYRDWQPCITRIEYTCIEQHMPNVIQARSILRAIDWPALKLRRVTHGDMKKPASTKFDIIIASHVIYYFNNEIELLEWLNSLQHLAPKGVIVFESPDSWFNDVRTEFGASMLSTYRTDLYRAMRKAIDVTDSLIERRDCFAYTSLSMAAGRRMIDVHYSLDLHACFTINSCIEFIVQRPLEYVYDFDELKRYIMNVSKTPSGLHSKVLVLGDGNSVYHLKHRHVHTSEAKASVKARELAHNHVQSLNISDHLDVE